MQKLDNDLDIHSNELLIEWQVCNDDTEWETTNGAPHATLTTKREPTRWNRSTMLHWGVAVALSILFVALPLTWWLWHQAQLGVAQVQNELHSAADADLWRAVHIPPTLASESESDYLNDILLHSPENAQEKVTDIEIRDLGKDWAVVRVFLRLQNNGATYRQSRIYRESDRGWERAAVTTALWGQAQQVESAHFIYNYRSIDQKAITDAASQIEASYNSLFRTLFARRPDNEKVMVVVHPERRIEVGKHQEQPSGVITIGSPAAILAPADLSEGELMAQSVVLEVLFMLSQKASYDYEIPSRWQPLRDAIRLWLLWDQELPLATWRRSVVRSAFSQEPNEDRTHGSSFSDFAYKLCANHALWMTTPLEMGIPLMCLPRNTNLGLDNGSQILSWRIAASQAGYIPLPVPLSNYPGGRSIGANDSNTKVVVLATVVDYIGATYGKECLPVLLSMLRQHDNWETLIPALYGISEEEFVAGWHAFLSKEYGIKEE